MRYLKILGFVALALVLAFSTIPPKAVAQEKYMVAVLFDVGGRGDLGFNDMAWLGAEKAKEELAKEGITVEVVYQTPKSESDYVPLLEQYASSGKYILIVCVGFLWSDALSNVAPKYPNQKFAIIDAVVDQPNVASYIFRENEGSALVGALAAALTKTGKIGIVLGMEIPVLWKFEIGYGFGAKWAADKLGKKVEVYYYYTGTFGDPSKGREAATAMLDRGVDVIYQAAGATGLGVIEAVYERYKATGKQLFAIGVDSNQDWIHPEVVITSMRKKVDVAVMNAIIEAVKGTFKAGVHELGLKENGVGYTTPDDLANWKDLIIEYYKSKEGLSEEKALEKFNQILQIRQQVWNEYVVKPGYDKMLEELKQKIISGEIKVPVPTSDTIKQLRQQYMTEFTITTGGGAQTVTANTTMIIAAVVIVVIIVLAVIYLLKRK